MNSFLRENGFKGGLAFSELRARRNDVPQDQGVYVVAKPLGFSPSFLNVGSGGYFKNRDPNVSIPELHANWLEHADVLYIGKGGGNSLRSTLRKRLLQYLSFGEGKKAGHYGGRYVWQLENSMSLNIYWKVTDVEASDVERSMLLEFKAEYGSRPFANLRG